MRFLMALVVVASLALHLTYRCITYFHIFRGEGFELPAAMAGKRCLCGEMVSSTSGTGDPACQGSAVSSLHKAETLGHG